MKNNVIILGLDGVIANDEAYWDAAGLVVHELLYSSRCWNISESNERYRPAQTAEASRRISRQVLPAEVIARLKACSVNSPWDISYCGFCLCLITLLSRLPDLSSLLPLRPEQADWMVTFRRELMTLPSERKAIDPAMFSVFSHPPFQGTRGREFIEQFNVYASMLLDHPIDIFGCFSPSWLFCQNLFQQWYLGTELCAQSYHHSPAQPGKPGCIYFERLHVQGEMIRAVLTHLCEQGYLLGLVTNRPGTIEGTALLKKYGLSSYFEDPRIVTYSEVAEREIELSAQGTTVPLVKPHPYQFLRAANPDDPSGLSALPRGSFIVVAATPDDIEGGRAAGALTIAVLAGASTPEARVLLEQSHPDFLVDDMAHLPDLLVENDDLAMIQHLQFTDRSKAELLLQRWFAWHMHMEVESITLTPKAVSLNSFNGIYRLRGEEYFFKTHVEEQAGMQTELYHAEMLSEAGYPIVKPLYLQQEQGRQMVIYPVVYDPVMFDLMCEVETGAETFATIEMLVAAEKLECEHLLSIYQATLACSSAEEHARAPIHQLFWHRLTGGRLAHFYAGKQVPLPGNPQQPATSILFEDLLNYRWSLNGKLIAGAHETLGASIERAKIVLNPEREAMTVIGHGDAHFGNVLLMQKQHYCYFDPAFAGRHSALLDIVKPFFHNVFATWMYFPNEVARDLQLSVELRDECVFVEHNYVLTPVRRAILETKLEYLLHPLKAWLRSLNALPDDWCEMINLALMCCPLLTLNLLDVQRFSAPLTWLGLSQVMEMCNFLCVSKERENQC